VVDSASYSPTRGAPDGLLTIFGTNLATVTATAQTVPLPLQLGGTTVTYYGAPAPLLYVSPRQINFQVPGNALTGGAVVTTAAGTSELYQPANSGATGLFSADSSGCGQAAVLNINGDGTSSLNSATNSALPGQWVSLWGTNGAGVSVPPAGVATPLSPLYGGIPAWPEFDFGSQNYTSSQYWSGFAPGLAGVNQFNVQIPSSVREGCAVPVQLANPGTAAPVSQPLTVAIRNGGGPCTDPPPAGYGWITWQKTVSTTAAQAVSESDAVTVSLQSSPGMRAPVPPVYTEGSSPFYVRVSGPACHVPGYRSLDAGAVAAQGPALSPAQAPSAPFAEGKVGGLAAYQVTLPAGTALQAGRYTVTATGGADVGAFQAAAQFPADIQIQTSLAGAPAFVNCAPLTVTWTGGDPNSWVTVWLFQPYGDSTNTGAFGTYEHLSFSQRVRTSDGTASLSPPGGPSGPGEPGCAVPGGIQGVVTVEVDPDPSEVTSFAAPGLTLGGQIKWKYIHTFEADSPAD
jgi:uncharacterized protein (TIGR03437 family)